MLDALHDAGLPQDATTLPSFLKSAPRPPTACRGRSQSAKLPHLRNLIFIGDPPAPSSMMPWNDLLQMGEGVPADALRGPRRDAGI